MSGGAEGDEIIGGHMNAKELTVPTQLCKARNKIQNGQKDSLASL
jgi:hypothetical protein